MTPDNGYTVITQEVTADIRWFRAYAQKSNGTQLIAPQREDFFIECDSCLEEGGGHSKDLYYMLEYDQAHREQCQHITQLEAVNLVTAYRTLAPHNAPGLKVVIFTDNPSSKHALSTGRTKCTVLCTRAVVGCCNKRPRDRSMTQARHSAYTGRCTEQATHLKSEG